VNQFTKAKPNYPTFYPRRKRLEKLSYNRRVEDTNLLPMPIFTFINLKIPGKPGTRDSL